MDELQLIEITDGQRAVLAAAVDHPGRLALADGRTLAALKRRFMVARDGTLTDLGRYQVRWYADDCARRWGIETGTWHQYVKRGTAPQATQRGTFGSSTDRPWWDPRTVIDFKRPTSAHRKGKAEKQLDMAAIVRQIRADPKISYRALARMHGVAPSTLISRLEAIGEKPPTTSTRAVREQRDRATADVERAS